MALFNCKVGSTESLDFSNFTVTSIQRTGTKTQTISCEIGDIIVVGTTNTTAQGVRNPHFTSGATEIEAQTHSGNRYGVIGKATDTAVTIEWYGTSTDGYIRVIHTPYLKNSSYTIEKSNSTSMSSKNITGLKVGDIIVGNTGWGGSDYDNIRSVVNGASLVDTGSIGSCYVAIKSEVLVTFGGSATDFTVVAIRQ